MLAVTKDRGFTDRPGQSARQYTPRAALGFWFAASAGGWLLIGAVLYALGVI